MSTGNDGLIFALGAEYGKRNAKKRRQRQPQPSTQPEGCLVALAKGFLWLTFWGRLTLVIGSPIIIAVAS